jgi:hypothetical protein
MPHQYQDWELFLASSKLLPDISFTLQLPWAGARLNRFLMAALYRPPEIHIVFRCGDD